MIAETPIAVGGLGGLIAISAVPAPSEPLDLGDPDVVVEVKTLMFLSQLSDEGKRWWETPTFDGGTKRAWGDIADAITEAAREDAAAHGKSFESARYRAALSTNGYPSGAGLILLPRYVSHLHGATAGSLDTLPLLRAWTASCSAATSGAKVYEMKATCPVKTPGGVPLVVVAASTLGVAMAAWWVFRRRR